MSDEHLSITSISQYYAERLWVPDVNKDFKYFFELPPQQRPGIIIQKSKLDCMFYKARNRSSVFSKRQINSCLPGAAYMHQSTGSALVQIMAWRRMLGSSIFSKRQTRTCLPSDAYMRQ